MHYVYILKSKRFSRRIYIGFTCNIERRLLQHNQGKSLYTKPFRPWNLIYYEAYLSQKDAKEREQQMNNRAASSAVSACSRRLFTPPMAGFIICTPLHPRGKPRGIRGQIIKHHAKVWGQLKRRIKWSKQES